VLNFVSAGYGFVDEDGTGEANDYVLVCNKCLENIGEWCPVHWQRATDNHGNVLWEREG
jgi:hypothetical protein